MAEVTGEGGVRVLGQHVGLEMCRLIENNCRSVAISVKNLTKILNISMMLPEFLTIYL